MSARPYSHFHRSRANNVIERVGAEYTFFHFPLHPLEEGSKNRTIDYMYLTKNNFIFISEILEHVFYIVYQMRPAFIGIQLYPFVFDKAPQYFDTIQFW